MFHCFFSKPRKPKNLKPPLNILLTRGLSPQTTAGAPNQPSKIEKFESLWWPRKPFFEVAADSSFFDNSETPHPYPTFQLSGVHCVTAIYNKHTKTPEEPLTTAPLQDPVAGTP